MKIAICLLTLSFFVYSIFIWCLFRIRAANPISLWPMVVFDAVVNECAREFPFSALPNHLTQRTCNAFRFISPLTNRRRRRKRHQNKCQNKCVFSFGHIFHHCACWRQCIQLHYSQRNLHDFPYRRDGQCRHEPALCVWLRVASRLSVPKNERWMSRKRKEEARNESGTILRVPFFSFDHSGMQASNGNGANEWTNCEHSLSQEARVVMFGMPDARFTHHVICITPMPSTLCEVRDVGVCFFRFGFLFPSVEGRVRANGDFLIIIIDCVR